MGRWWCRAYRGFDCWHRCAAGTSRCCGAGNAISLAGDQFQTVALAVLALDVTGSAAVLGTVLAVQAIPRVLLMLIGGVVADRFRPRGVMLTANALQGTLVAMLATVLWLERLETWHLYAYAAASGMA